MKKRILLISVFTVVALNIFAQVCSPDPKYAASKSGFWPDFQENLPLAYASDAAGYNAVINLKTLTDTSIVYLGNNIKVTVSEYKLVDIIGLPSGFTFATNQPTWKNGGTDPNFTSVQGCIKISASQADIQKIMATNPNGIDFKLKIKADAFITSAIISSFPPVTTPVNMWASDLDTIGNGIFIEGYVLKIRQSPQASGISSLTSDGFYLEGNFPNPFSKTTEIKFNVPNRQAMDFQVFNMIGDKVISQSIHAQKGENSITINGEHLKPGIYYYTLSDGKKSITKRMLLNAN